MQKNLTNVNDETVNPIANLTTDKDTDFDQLSEIIFDDLLNEIVLGLCLQMHRSSKLGFLFLDESNYGNDEEKQYAIVNQKGFDVFGYSTTQIKKQLDCFCPTCSRPISAQRFAPHLEKCMGMGRNSSRIAIKRIASSTSKYEENSDEDTAVFNRKVKKKKTSSKKNNNNNHNNFNSIGNNSNNNGLAI